jgi:Flp pilus assembly pilin Flp
MLTRMNNLLRNRRGQSLVEYGIIIGGVAIVSLAAIAILGHKTNDLVGSSASLLPGAHADDNGPIFSGKLVQTTDAADGPIRLSSTPGTFESNLGITGAGTLVTDEP